MIAITRLRLLAFGITPLWMVAVKFVIGGIIGQLLAPVWRKVINFFRRSFTKSPEPTVIPKGMVAA